MSRSNSKTKLNSRQQKVRGKQNSSSELEGTKKIDVPQLAWKVVSESAMQELKAMKDIDEVARKLADILSLSNCEVDLRQAAELDYFVAGFWCARKEWQWTSEQVSAFISLLHTVLYNLKTKEFSLCENLKELQGLMSNVDNPNVPSSLECFTKEVAGTALQYIQSTLFQHYSLFQYVFTETQKLSETHTAKVDIELPNLERVGNTEQCFFPAPLEESLPLDVYTRCKAFDSKSEETDSGKEEITKEESEDAVQTADAITVSSMDEEEIQISSNELKDIMEDMAKATLQPFQNMMNQKIKEKEDFMASRLLRLEKALNVHDKQ